MHLVIVESPAKAKTINKYLGADYKVVASYGHVRDLLPKDGSVQPDNNFAMIWETSPRGNKQIQEIKRLLKNSDELLLATDPDREGEAISWHIKEVLTDAHALKVPVKRIAFHEITKGAIKDAINNARDIDSSLVDAYMARRALDYLVGFTLSPILWRKLPGSKSAGRVQSVALRIIVDRETEIEAFEKKEYWSLDATFLSTEQKQFEAKLTHHKGKKLNKFSVENEKDAEAIRAYLLGRDYKVTEIESKIVNRNPAPAFITSTLQQEASRKLGFSAKKTMQLAQNLYEGVDIGGETQALITYMRTDSVNLSAEAVNKIRNLIGARYGEKFLPAKPRSYQTKVKNAQEAHEAIRPINADITPDQLQGKLAPDLFKLYSLIWKRAVASQMSSAEINQVQVDISDDEKNIFRATGSTIVFEGFLKLYVEGTDEQEEEEGMLPKLAKGDVTPLKSLKASQHFTTPPPRYSEASLVKKLEELGIGRPSTYATILQVLRDRNYVKLVKKYFVPEIRGRLVTAFLTNFFERYLQYDFTANLEQSLDDISNGLKSKLEILNGFWREFQGNVDQTKGIKISDVIDKLNESLEAFLFKSGDKISRVCPECGEGTLSLKIGKFGSFIGCSRYPECKFVKRLDSAETSESNEQIAGSTEYPKFLGVDPTDNREISFKKGPYGLYVEKSIDCADKKQKPPRASIPSFVTPESVNLDVALKLLALPKIIGTYEDSEVKVGIGRYGPYVFYNGKYTSIPQKENSIPDLDDICNLSLDQAIEIIKNPPLKVRKRG